MNHQIKRFKDNQECCDYMAEKERDGWRIVAFIPVPLGKDIEYVIHMVKDFRPLK